MPLPTHTPAASVITLGRGKTNTVVLTEPNVSTHHARLIIDQGGIVLEDLGSTNGTAVGSMENKISRSAVKSSDTIFLGSTAYRVADLIARSRPAPLKSAAERGRRPSPSRSPMNRPASWIAIGAVLGLVVLLGWLATRDGNSPERPQAKAPDSQASLQPTVPSDDSAGEAHAPAADRESEDRSTARANTELTPAERLARSLFLIICSDPQGENSFRIGTGFAVDARHVATAATVIQSMGDLRANGFPNVRLHSPATSEAWSVASTRVHPQYEPASAAALAAQQAHDAIFDELNTEQPAPEAFEGVKERLLTARMNALQAIDRKTSYDVGLIRVTEPISHWLPGVGADAALRPKMRLNISGCAIDVEDPYYDPSVPTEVTTMSCRLGQLLTPPDGSAARLVVDGAQAQHEFRYTGSPIVNTQGQVVGVYSRPTPVSEGDAEQDASQTLDAALFQRIRECLNE